MTQFETHVDVITKKGTLRLIVIPILITILVYILPSIFQMLFTAIFPAPLEQIGSLPATLGMIATLCIAVPLMCKISGLKPQDLGLAKRGALRASISGAFCGLFFLALVFSILFLTKTISVTLNPQRSLGAIGVGLIFFIAQGSWEELMYRSWLMPHLSKIWGLPAAIIVSSLVFVAGHALNPGMQALPVINLFIASVVFSLAYWKTGSLWFVGFAHGIWNFSQGFIFGAEVSGNGIATSILRSVSHNTLIAGGPFGFEGGLAVSMIGIALICVMVLVKQKPGKELV